MTKREKDILQCAMQRYNSETATELEDVYKSASAFKYAAMRYWKRRSADLHGTSVKILSHTAQFFTIGFYYPDPVTGVLRFTYATGRNVYDGEAIS